METIGHHKFYNELKVAPGRASRFALGPKAYRQRMTETRLRRSTCPPWRPRLSCTFRDARRTCRTQCSTNERYILHHTILLVAGRDLTEYLTKHLTDRARHGDPGCPVRFGTHDGRVVHSAPPAKGTLTEGTLSLLPQGGRFHGMSQRNRASLS